MKLIHGIKVASLFGLLFLSLFSCKKDNVSSDSGLKLSFSADTVTFDTVFSSVGSSTLRFKVYNRNSASVKISEVKLNSGLSSVFRVNLNGRSGVEFRNIELKAKDSLWVFVEVTINPNAGNLPFEITDYLSFLTNGNSQGVLLQAWGQNAIFHRPLTGDTTIIGHSEIWDSSIPHVVYGVLKIDSNSTLTINAGGKVYFHPGSYLIIGAGSELLINGTNSGKVVFQGDRLEKKYEELPGQWGGVILEEGTGNHKFYNLEIKNASTGIYAKGQGAGDFIVANHLTIKNCLNYGIRLDHTQTKFYNASVTDCGANALLVEFGGNHEFYHCTFNNATQSSAQGSSNTAVVIQNWKFVDNEVANNDLANFKMYNSIVYGGNSSEIVLSDKGSQFVYHFYNSLVKYSKTTDAGFSNCVFNESPVFVKKDLSPVLLGEGSAAFDIGDATIVNSYLPELQYDLKGENRLADGLPDAGAFEFSAAAIE